MRMALSVSLLALGFACQRANPAYVGPADGGRDLATEASGDAGPDTTPDTGPACVTAADCVARNPAAVCGAWNCFSGVCGLNCPNCTDSDRDGYGVGTGCAGPDCDDSDPTIHATAQRSCYDGPAGTAGRGTCRAGNQICTNGVWTACSGQVVPSGEACNGEDDDCNGPIDDDLPTFTCGLGACLNNVASCGAGGLGACVPHTTSVDVDSTCDGIDDDCDGQIDEDCPQTITDCIHVSPDGDSSGANGTVDNPFNSIQAAITFAASAGTGPKTVCVAGGQSCTNQTSYTAEAPTFQMSNGVSVYGNYESRNWTRCPLDPATPNPNVTIQLREAGGVRFPPSIITPTVLDGFSLTRANAAGGTTAAVTVNGAKQVRLSNLVIEDSPQALNSYGINLIGGGEALITHCAIEGGAGTAETIGVRSLQSKPTIRENCSALDPATGRCTSACSTSPWLGIWGRVTGAATGTSTAVYLEASPGASVASSSVCGEQGLRAIGIHLIGDASDTVIRGNMISANSGVTDSLGIWAEDCAAAAPWIVGNSSIEGQGSNRAIGVLSVGSCHPVIDGNSFITAGGTGNATAEADGVSCLPNSNGEPSRCAVLGNELIQGSINFRPTVAAGIACKDKGCGRVAGNVVQGNLGGEVIGVWLRHDGATIEQNRIIGGCGLQSASGILADDAFARLQNNLISGGSCVTATVSSPLSIGLRVYSADDQNEIDIHSNTIDGGGNPIQCVSVGIEYGVGPETPPTVPKGIVRNNIVRAGVCNTRSDFAEVRVTSDPRIFENNDLDPTGAPVLYLDEATTALRTAAGVNALTDITARNNLDATPMFASPIDLHLGTGSACIGAGTPVGAPANDYDGKARSTSRPSIGAYE